LHGNSEVGRAIINYSSEELEKVKGQQSSEFEKLLGYPVCAEACYRGNIMLTTDENRSMNRLPKGLHGHSGQGLSLNVPTINNSLFQYQ